jgi:hypothetical protein
MRPTIYVLKLVVFIGCKLHIMHVLLHYTKRKVTLEIFFQYLLILLCRWTTTSSTTRNTIKFVGSLICNRSFFFIKNKTPTIPCFSSHQTNRYSFLLKKIFFFFSSNQTVILCYWKKPFFCYWKKPFFAT